ncbi:MAG TPA: inverse autotransporter beta domain-containing protein, partial [Candidatus Saccharimonadia bacterium]|nr:inverse autotransporter beta domain-containing protein [Candidatus Saccharimonadia bacterium]
MNSFRNKTFRALVSAITLVATTVVHSGTPLPQPKVVIIPSEHPMYLGTINGGIKGNDAYTDGNFSIVAPLWSTMGAEGTLSGGSLFLEPYISWGEGGEVATSLGLGYRYLFGNQSMDALLRHDGHQAGFLEEGVAVGANLFVDMLDTDAGNQFWQLGFGLEVQTRYLELRGNYYLPLTERQLAEETRKRQTFSSSSSSTSLSQTGSGIGDPYAAGNTIAQDINFSTLATTTTRTTTTTIEQLFRRYEEGMEGWDAEAAVLVPYLDRWFDLKLIAGYYSFDNQPFGPQQGGTGNVEGWKAGVEVRPVPAVILNGTWYEDDRLTGGDWTVGLQLQFPFEGGDLGDGKDFWDR